MRLGIVYRPPPSKDNKLKTSTFFEEWSVFLEKYATCTTFSDMIIMGDVIFHLDTICNSDTRRFNDILEAHGLKQHVKEPTHLRGHTFDVVITSKSCDSKQVL